MKPDPVGALAVIKQDHETMGQEAMSQHRLNPGAESILLGRGLRSVQIAEAIHFRRARNPRCTRPDCKRLITPTCRDTGCAKDIRGSANGIDQLGGGGGSDDAVFKQTDGMGRMGLFWRPQRR